MMNNPQRSFFFNVDWVMVFIYLALCTIGLLNIHSAVYDERHPTFLDFNTDYGKQLLYVVVGLCVGIVILLLETRF
ncbi:MAG: rod shape-determining protein RodA, partial [Mucilaginibacter sp.]